MSAWEDISCRCWSAAALAAAFWAFIRVLGTLASDSMENLWNTTRVETCELCGWWKKIQCLLVLASVEAPISPVLPTLKWLEMASFIGNHREMIKTTRDLEASHPVCWDKSISSRWCIIAPAIEVPISIYMEVSEHRGTPQIVHVNRVFPYKPSLLGYLHCRKPPFFHIIIPYYSTLSTTTNHYQPLLTILCHY